MATTSTSAARAFHAPRGWIEPLARAGYVTKGVVHAVIGVLAIQTVIGSRGDGELGGGETAVRTVAQQPFGQALLIVLGAGLFAYAAWRFVGAILDPEGTGRDGAKGVARRIGWGISGVIYAALGVLAMQLALGDATSAGTGRQTWVARVLAWDHGTFLVVGAGAAVILYALYEIYRAWTIDFTKNLMVTRMTATERRWSVRAGRLGIFARGVVFVILGGGIVQAGLDAQPSEARGIGGALADIASQPYGAALLAIVAAGLIAYGVFQLVLARYRRIPSRV
jgi:hypothetical protein